MISPDAIRLHVRAHYRNALTSGSCGCGDCCSAEPAVGHTAELAAEFLGPALGCGSPVAHADLQQGEVVVDLGSGAGGDVLRAVRQIGPDGKAIGVDMTPEMIATARENAARAGYDNVEFRLGEIEHLPLADGSADVVISNCVINLVPDKRRAFSEAFRVLNPGGRLIVSDMVSHGMLPEAIRRDPTAWAACIAGALPLDDYRAQIAEAGFEEIMVLAAGDAVPGQVYSVTLRARKPESSN